MTAEYQKRNPPRVVIYNQLGSTIATCTIKEAQGLVLSLVGEINKAIVEGAE